MTVMTAMGNAATIIRRSKLFMNLLPSLYLFSPTIRTTTSSFSDCSGKGNNESAGKTKDRRVTRSSGRSICSTFLFVGQHGAVVG
jgi:hypothetical protein